MVHTPCGMVLPRRVCSVSCRALLRFRSLAVQCVHAFFYYSGNGSLLVVRFGLLLQRCVFFALSCSLCSPL